MTHMERNEEMVIDIQRLLKSLLDKFGVILTSAVGGAIALFLATLLLITPKYESAAMFYVNNNDLSVGDASFSISSSDITASKSLVESYIVILQTRETLTDVIDYADVNRSILDVRKMITAASVNDTEIFEVVVESTDPAEAERIADAIAYILPKRISSIIEGTSAKVVDAAVMPVKPSSPSFILNTLIGFVLGITMSVSIIILREMIDTTLRTEEDLAQSTELPVLAAVPDMTSASKGGYYTYDTSSQKAKSSASSHGKHPVLVGRDISFAASEAYKLLRTKLQFSFADESGCRVIGVSSALSGEGKSLSSVNLAFSLSELDSNVLLIDCDMRRPSLAAKLPIQKNPGLSNYLSGQCELNDLFQYCGIKNEEKAFYVISAGQNPPNPAELLSSARMGRMLETLRKKFTYIILDLPPVGEVSDALAVAKLTDGMLLVARQNYGDRVAFSNAVRQFTFVESKILGVVYNCATEGFSAYGKKYYKKYSKYGKNESAYHAADRNARRASANKSAEQRGVSERK